jgi:hypothetical protein
MSNEPYQSPHAPYAPPATSLGIPVQQPSEPFSSTASTGGRRKGLLIAGIAVLLAGLIGAVVAFLAADSALEDGVKSLARAPVGCTTRLDFDTEGTFTIYVETTGSTGDPGGDCPNNEQDFERDSDDIPDVDLVLVGPDGDEVDLGDDDSKSYDAAGAVGTSIRSIDIDEAGEYELTVTSEDDDFAIAVGKNPEAAADTLKLISYALAGIGVVLGTVLILLGLRRKRSSATPTGAPVTYYPEQQPPSAYAPTGAHTPPSPPPSYAGGGFAPPSRPSDSSPPTQQQPRYEQPTQQQPTTQWPAPPGS